MSDTSTLPGPDTTVDAPDVSDYHAAFDAMYDALLSIRNLIDSPHWTTARKYRIRVLADAAMMKARGEQR
jgi:hypothetical protein